MVSSHNRLRWCNISTKDGLSMVPTLSGVLILPLDSFILFIVFRLLFIYLIYLISREKLHYYGTNTNVIYTVKTHLHKSYVKLLSYCVSSLSNFSVKDLRSLPKTEGLNSEFSTRWSPSNEVQRFVVRGEHCGRTLVEGVSQYYEFTPLSIFTDRVIYRVGIHKLFIIGNNSTWTWGKRKPNSPNYFLLSLTNGENVSNTL